MSQDQALSERLAFMQMDDKARDALRRVQPTIAKSVGPALEAFYAKVRATPETRRFFKDEQHIASAGNRQKAHWAIIASGQFDTGYVEAVRKVGQIHARIGLEPRWYIGGYAVVADHLIQSLVEQLWPKGLMGRKGAQEAGESLGAVVKATMLDIDFAISIYLETIDVERQRLAAARLADEQAQSILMAALGESLDRLSRGDLSTRIATDVAPEFQKLKDDFNQAVEQLAQTMSRVSATTGSISSSVGEIAVAADDLSRRTENQAASLEQTAAALDEITKTVHRTASGAQQASAAAGAAKIEADQSGVIVTEAVGAMGEIAGSSRQIGSIIGVIDEIAFQTNLLALNAGVEAARAGDAGRGFAVVAQEVRALAQRSADAAKQIKGLIATSTRQVEQGVKLVDQTGTALRAIADKVTDIDRLILEISRSADAESAGLLEVNAAVTQMDQVTQQNAAMVEQTTAATHSLSDQTAELVDLVSRFEVSPDQSRQGGRVQGPRPPVVAMKTVGRGGAARKPATATAAQTWEEF
jgi:methyl-accepting chemotaxis protein